MHWWRFLTFRITSKKTAFSGYNYVLNDNGNTMYTEHCTQSQCHSLYHIWMNETKNQKQNSLTIHRPLISATMCLPHHTSYQWVLLSVVSTFVAPMCKATTVWQRRAFKTKEMERESPLLLNLSTAASWLLFNLSHQILLRLRLEKIKP